MGHIVKSLSGAVIQLVLYFLNILRRNVRKVGSLRQVLPYEPVHVFVRASVARTVGAREKTPSFFRGRRAATAAFASSSAFLPLSFRIHKTIPARSLIVSRAPFLFLPITVSISRSPKRSFRSTTDGRSSMPFRLGMRPLHRQQFCCPTAVLAVDGVSFDFPVNRAAVNSEAYCYLGFAFATTS